MQLTKKQFAAIRAVMPAAVSDNEITTKALVVTATGEIICLSGATFGKCRLPIELPAMPTDADVQAYNAAFAAAGCRPKFVTASTKNATGGYRSEYVCRIYRDVQKEPVFVASQKSEPLGTQSLAGVNLQLLKQAYAWIAQD